MKKTHLLGATVEKTIRYDWWPILSKTSAEGYDFHYCTAHTPPMQKHKNTYWMPYKNSPANRTLIRIKYGNVLPF